MTWTWDSSTVKFDSTGATMDGHQFFVLAMALLEQITVTDTEIDGCIRLRSVIESLSTAEQNSKVMQLCRSLVDAFSATDLFGAKGRLFLALIETFGISDQNTKKLTRILVQKLLEAFGMGDVGTPASVRLITQKLNEGIVTSDQPQLAIARIRNLFEALTAKDVSSAGVALMRGIIEAVSLIDVESPSAQRLMLLQDAITVISRHGAIPIRQRLLIESILATDAKQWTPLKVRTLLEAILTIDAATAVYLPFVFAGINPATPIVVGGR